MKTVVNNQSRNPTRLNRTPAGRQTENLEGERILGEKYTLVKPMGVVSGEADLYICADSHGARRVAKIYRRKDAVKPEVLKTLRRLDSPYVAKIVDSGEHNGYPVVVLPYFRNGSLAGRILEKTFDCETLRNVIIPSVARGLKYLHENGIVHKDIKPSNLMISDDRNRIEIIDFGISSARSEGQSVLVTRTGLSPEYSAPETFSNVFLDESDYYSFGITLYELFAGGTPFAGGAAGELIADELAARASVQSIPFPEALGFPDRLKLLIKGLTYRDLTHRNEPDNPNRRWVWRDVERWMNDEELPAPGEADKFATVAGNNGGAASSAVSPSDELQDTVFSQAYDFRNAQGKVVRLQTLSELVRAFGTSWKEGKKHVGRGLLSDFLRERKIRSLVSVVLDCEEAGASDDAYSKMLMDIAAGCGGALFYWNGREMTSLKDLGQYLNEAMIGGSLTEAEYEAAMKAARHWRELKRSDDEIEVMDRLKRIAEASGNDLKAGVAGFCSCFCEDMRLKIGERIFDNIGELEHHVSALKDDPERYLKWIAHSWEDIERYSRTNNRHLSGILQGALDLWKAQQERIRQEEALRKQRAREQYRRKLIVGAIAEFGKYFAGNGRGPEPLRWKVIAREETRVLLIAEQGIDCKPYHQETVGRMRVFLRAVFGRRRHENADIAWENCSLRSWLNTSFLETCFSAAEQSMILSAAAANNAGNDTSDRIFLLSVDEARKHFQNDRDRRCEVTAYAKSRGAFVYPNNTMFGRWWLRSRGYSGDHVAYVSLDGSIDDRGLGAGDTDVSVRPALWLKI